VAPYGRTGMQYFYADNAGLERLQVGLKLSRLQRRECRSHPPKDQGLFRDIIEPAPEPSARVRSRPTLTSPLLANAGGKQPIIYGKRGSHAEVNPPEPQSAADYDDRTTAAVKSVLIEIGQILGSFQGKFAVVGGAVRGCCWITKTCRMSARST